MAPNDSFVRLCPFVQPSPYGKKGANSLAARFAAATRKDFKIDEEQSYGEARPFAARWPLQVLIGGEQMWMGDHPNGMAHTLDGTPLVSLIEGDPEAYLGSAVHRRFGGDKHLPFLFKILSFDKALPLQAHPDRALATRLMANEKAATGGNGTFADPNHKPEVAVAVSDSFEGFVGFRPVREIKTFLKIVPELRTLLSDHATAEAFLAAPDDSDAARGHLKAMFAELLDAANTAIAACSRQLLTHVERNEDDAIGDLGRRQGLARVIRKVLADYPEDVGMFAAVFFLNFVVLHNGQGIAVPADCIHAYLEGDVIECMARSDNMVRASPTLAAQMASELTGERIACGLGAPAEQNDARVFVEMLRYDASEARRLGLAHETWARSASGRSRLFRAPMDEFDLLNTKLEPGQGDAVDGGIDGPAVFVVTHGEATLSRTDGTQAETLREGQVVFVKPRTSFRLAAEQGAQVWGAFVEA
jgi:mannose-6-phosphate isomerase